MTRTAIIKALAVIRAAWPRFYLGQTQQDAAAAVELWYGMLGGYDEDVFRAAIDMVIRESAYPPTIADICTRILSMAMAVNDGPTPESLWAKIERAASNALYHAGEEFEALPEVCRRFVGSPGALQAMAMMDPGDFNSVTRGQFIRSAGAMMKQEEMARKIPGEVRERLEGGGEDGQARIGSG
jgi:hypothetical protein